MKKVTFELNDYSQQLYASLRSHVIKDYMLVNSSRNLLSLPTCIISDEKSNEKLLYKKNMIRKKLWLCG